MAPPRRGRDARRAIVRGLVLGACVSCAPVPVGASVELSNLPVAGSSGMPSGSTAPSEPGASRSSPVSSTLPPWSDFAKAVNKDGWHTGVQASERLWLTPASAVAVMRTEQRDGARTTWRISLVRLERSGETWIQSGVRSLQSWAQHDQLNRDGSIAVYLDVRDLEQDQELDIVARFKLLFMCCGGGETNKRTLVISNNDQTLSESAYVDLDAQNYHSAVRGQESFVDRNGDGHADLVIAQTDRFEDTVSHGEVIHLWEPSSDQYADARRPLGDDCHCE